MAPAFFKGRGIFNRNSKGLLPYRESITSVVGAPIKCPRLEGSMESEENCKIVDEYHLKYMAALKALWGKYKEDFAKKRRGSIQFRENKFDFIEPLNRTSDNESDEDGNMEGKVSVKKTKLSKTVEEKE